MKALENAKYANAINPVDTNGTTTNGTGVNVSGCWFAACVVNTGNVAANMTALKIQQSDDDGSSDAYADVTGATWTSPTAANGDNKTYIAFIPLGGTREKYLRLVATGGAGATLVSGTWILLPITQSPNSATEYGAAEVLYV